MGQRPKNEGEDEAPNNRGDQRRVMRHRTSEVRAARQNGNESSNAALPPRTGRDGDSRFPHRNASLDQQSTAARTSLHENPPGQSFLTPEAKQSGGWRDGPALHEQRGDYQNEDAGEQALIAADIGQCRNDAEIDRDRPAQPDPGGKGSLAPIEPERQQAGEDGDRASKKDQDRRPE